jgi:predicted transcriptional regulator
VRVLSFPDWLQGCSQEPSQADRLATFIAGVGAAGVSLDRIRALVHLPPDTLQDILRSLVATEQVVALKVGGQLVYRVAG